MLIRIDSINDMSSIERRPEDECVHSLRRRLLIEGSASGRRDYAVGTE